MRAKNYKMATVCASKEVLQKVLEDENMDEYSSRFLNTVERVSGYAISNETVRFRLRVSVNSGNLYSLKGLNGIEIMPIEGRL